MESTKLKWGLNTVYGILKVTIGMDTLLGVLNPG